MIVVTFETKTVSSPRRLDCTQNLLEVFTEYVCFFHTEGIALFGSILRMRNLLVAFDEFRDKELIDERDLQDYLGRYQDLRDEWKRKRENGENTDIINDIV